jgi:hypothetical protein
MADRPRPEEEDQQKSVQYVDHLVQPEMTERLRGVVAQEIQSYALNDARQGQLDVYRQIVEPLPSRIIFRNHRFHRESGSWEDFGIA